MRPAEWEHCDEPWCLFYDVSSLWSVREPKSSAVPPSAQASFKVADVQHNYQGKAAAWEEEGLSPPGAPWPHS